MSDGDGRTYSGSALLLGFIACCAANSIANATWWLQPLIVDQFVVMGRYSLSGVGAVVSVELAAIAIASSVAAAFLKGRRFLIIGAIASAVAAAGSLLSLLFVAFIPFLVVRAFTGLAEGICLMIANVAITQLGDPDRRFTQLAVVNVLFGIVLVSLMPLASFWPQQPAALVLVALVLCALAPLMLLMPGGLRLARVSAAGGAFRDMPGSARTRLSVLAASTFLVAVASGVMWSFYGIIGNRAGMSDAAVTRATAIAIFASFGGSGLAALLAGHIARRSAVLAGMLLMMIAIAMLSFNPSPWEFGIATCLNVAMIVFVTPYLLSAAASQEATGRGAAIASSTFFLGGAAAPLIAGALAEAAGIATIGIVAIASTAIVICLYLYGDRSTREYRPAAVSMH